MKNPKNLVLSEEVIRETWNLINSREWPFAMMESLAFVKIAFDAALEEAYKDEENKSTDTIEPERVPG